jgi:site-specific DNA recombinase
VWRILRNPAYRGHAAFGKKQVTGERTKATRRVRVRGERHGLASKRTSRPVEEWISIPVPAIVSDETFELAQARIQENKRFAARNTKHPVLLTGLVVCRSCGYACYRDTVRSSKRTYFYYRCIGSSYRHHGGRVCSSRAIRAEELDELVWSRVLALLKDPALIRAEIDRRLQSLRNAHPAAHRRDGLERELARVQTASSRLIEAYQEQLLTLEELRVRMPALRKREATVTAQLTALDAELHDAETYLKLTESLEGFLARLATNAENLTIQERQRVLRLVVQQVILGEDDITIRHSIPTPTGDQPPGSLLRNSGPCGPHQQDRCC